MKKLLIISCVALLAGCNNAGTTDAAKTDSSGTTAAAEVNKKAMPEMPYTLDKPYKNWQPGDQQHAYTVLTALKNYESGNVAECVKGFADTIELFMDGFTGKFSNDSLKTFFTDGRSKNTSINIKMQDWESVISEDKKEEWVTIWYKEKWVDQKGKADSMSVIDDCKIVNGKIAVLSEAVQHYPAAKK